MHIYRFLSAALLCSAVCLAPAWADIQTIDFNTPQYTPGNINLQQGWSNTGLYDANIVNTPYNGKVLQISNGKASGSFGDQTFTPHLAVPAGESSIPGALPIFTASWNFLAATNTIEDGLFISVSADNGKGARMTYVGMGEDSTSGLNLLFYDWNTTGGFVAHQTAADTHLALGVWHSVVMNVDFVNGPGNDVVTVDLDGHTVYTGTTWEDFYRYGPTSDGGGGGLSPVNSLLFRAGGTSVPSTLGKGFYIDNIMYGSAVPEPGTVGLLLAGLGGMVALARRRRSIAK